MHTHTLRDGREIPAVGFGTYPMSDAEAEANVAEAIMRGHRLVGAAPQSGNVKGVGCGVRGLVVDREAFVGTTKFAVKDDRSDGGRPGALDRHVQPPARTY